MTLIYCCKYLTLTRTDRIWNREGRIRLEDEEVDEKKVLEIRYSDFVLQPAPKTRSKTNSSNDESAHKL